MTKSIRGRGASEGIGIGEAVILREVEVKIPRHSCAQAEQEKLRLETALSEAKAEIRQLAQKTTERLGKSHGAIFEAHALMLEDPVMLKNALKLIEDKNYNASYALFEVSEGFAEMLLQQEQSYMQERAQDIRDAVLRVQKKLLNIENSQSRYDDSKAPVLIASDLSPSQLAELDLDKAQGIALEEGGMTSHVVLLAKALEIPTVIACENLLEKAENGLSVVVEGNSGQVVFLPEEKALSEYRESQEKFHKEKKELEVFKGKKSMSADGHSSIIAANVTSTLDLKKAVEIGAEGIGLFRTEFLFLGRKKAPTEEEQFEVYKRALESMKGHKVVVRTLDVGGDKAVDYLKMKKELNPFLGTRGIRYSLRNLDLFHTQIRALLRAHEYGQLAIMFPMISCLEEVQHAKAEIAKVHKSLVSEGKIAPELKVETGIMIEIPSAALVADQLAKEVDFFSIGTNDLMQYTFGVDRMCEELIDLYNPRHLALWRLIRDVIEAGHKEKIWVGMCGEIAGSPEFFNLLFGLGLDEFSVTPSSVLKTRKLLAETTLPEAQSFAKHALRATSPSDFCQRLEKKQ